MESSVYREIPLIHNIIWKYPLFKSLNESTKPISPRSHIINLPEKPKRRQLVKGGSAKSGTSRNIEHILNNGSSNLISSDSNVNKSNNSQIKVEASLYYHTIYKYSFKNRTNGYKDNFSHKDHNIYICQTEQYSEIYVVLKNIDLNNNRKGYLFGPYEQRELILPHKIDLTKYLKKRYKNVKKIKCNKYIIEDLIKHEEAHTSMIDCIEIGIIYGKHNQNDPLVMLTNQNDDISDNFKDFLNILDINNSNHDNIKVKYHLSTSMTFDQVRETIANSRCIIIFKENCDPIDLKKIDLLGVVNYYFIIVEYATVLNSSVSDNNLFNLCRIGFCQRISCDNYINIEPVIPINATFDVKYVKDLILTKLANCTISDKSSFMYFYPRSVSLNNLIVRYK